jgi:hypothetical protein
MWHMHLNGGFIALDEFEEKDYDARWPKRVQPGEHSIHDVWMRKNWDLVFDIREARQGYLLKNYGVLERIQLCVDRIYVNEVVDIREPARVR